MLSKLRLLAGLGLCAALLNLAPAAQAGEIEQLQSTLSGLLLSTSSPGSGLGTVTHDFGQISATLNVSGLLGNVTDAGIFEGNVELFPFTLGFPTSTTLSLSQVFSGTTQNVQDLEQSLYSFIVSTTAFPGGEISGNIDTPLVSNDVDPIGPSFVDSDDFAVAPEPSTFVLLAAGMAVIALRRRLIKAE
jgi:hypothetical protein